MMTKSQFATCVAAFTTMRQHYNHGDTTACVSVQRSLKKPDGKLFDSAKLTITGPVPVFIAIGGIIWGMAAAMESHLGAWVFDGVATWEILAIGEADQSQEDDDFTKRVFGS